MKDIYINSKPKQANLEHIRMNQLTYRRYFNWISDLAMSLFEWVNLPNGCNERFLEKMLFERGSVLFFKEDVVSEKEEQYLHLPFTQTGLDVYGEPSQMIARAVNGKGLWVRDRSNSVIIYNNYVREGDIETAHYYAKEIYEIKRSFDTNIKTQKFPYLLTAPQEAVHSVKQIYKKIEENEPMIVVSDKWGSIANIEVLRTETPFVADKLQANYKEIFNEMCHYFGINVSPDKKERMIVSEVMNGIGITEASRQIRLKTRKQACEQINKMFGLNVDVRFRKDVDMFERMLEMGIMREMIREDGEDIGILYNRS